MCVCIWIRYDVGILSYPILSYRVLCCPILSSSDDERICLLISQVKTQRRKAQRNQNKTKQKKRITPIYVDYASLKISLRMMFCLFVKTISLTPCPKCHALPCLSLPHPVVWLSIDFPVRPLRRRGGGFFLFCFDSSFNMRRHGLSPLVGGAIPFRLRFPRGDGWVCCFRGAPGMAVGGRACRDCPLGSMACGSLRGRCGCKGLPRSWLW